MSVSDHMIETLQESDIMTALKNVIELKDEITQPLASNIYKKLQDKWGGQRVYIPVNSKISTRNQLIKAEFNGTNHAEIIKLHGVSLRTLYRIIK